MPSPNDTPADEMIDSLPEIGHQDTFCFDCGPDVPCFNRCCAELTLPLTPYDMLRLHRQLGGTCEEIIRTFTHLRSFPDTGFPLLLMRMIESPDAPCPFVTPAGCSIYQDRPGACRSYPLGRGAKLGRQGVEERFFVVHEDHCRGFDHGACHTPAQWFENQGLEKYNFFNDRYMRLMSMIKATERPLDSRMANMCLVCLYQLDRFRELIEMMKIFSRVRISDEKKAIIMADSAEGGEARLNFAFDWMELLLFGQAENLEKKE